LNRIEALDAVKEILSQRQAEHGKADACFEKIAGFWSFYLDRKLDSQDIACLMILLKIARQSTGSNHPDNLLDAIGYSAIGIELDGYQEF
jgi:hypothetical protein